MPPTISEIMSRMPGALVPEKAKDVDAVVQFTFTGTQAGEWTAVIKNGKCDVAEGASPARPTMTLNIDSSDYIKMLTGELDGMQAFMQGRIKLTGDLNLAMKLMQMFRLQ